MSFSLVLIGDWSPKIGGSRQLIVWLELFAVCRVIVCTCFFLPFWFFSARHNHQSIISISTYLG
eukprot:m.39317 g.39317  ORF g.39317 m.39317 type:complete len:64 (-) comp10296_c0_seq1:3737-3928(-)